MIYCLQGLRTRYFEIAVLSLLLCFSTPSSSGQDATDNFVTDDDLLLMVNDQLPRFGGMFYDEKGILKIVITDLKTLPEGSKENGADYQPESIKSLLMSIYGEDTFALGAGMGADDDYALQPGPLTLELINGSYTVKQLDGWRLVLVDLLDKSGIVFLDLDEAINRVTLAVVDEQTRKNAYQITDERGIPRDALNIIISSPIKETARLTDDLYRPVVGGLGISMVSGDEGQSVTLGINAYRQLQSNIPDLWDGGFLTCSHCTKRAMNVDSDLFFQIDPGLRIKDPTWLLTAAPSYIGYEIIDPPPTHCYGFLKCRYSDAAFIRYALGADWTLGEIARPESENTGSITIDSAHPAFRIVSEGHHVISGEVLHKVGRSTGLTFGRVSRTCADSFGPDRVLRSCQSHVSNSRVTIAVTGGDSGGPVFKRHPGINNQDVTFYGIVWGRMGSGTFVFSPINNIERELNDLRVAFNSRPPAPPPPPQCPDGEKCCSIANTGSCRCFPENQACPADPSSGCPEGYICCSPGSDSCADCRPVGFRCDAF